MTEALEQLLAKVVSGNCNDFDPLFEFAFHPIRKNMRDTYACRDAYKGSLDAAKALHEAVLPGWNWATALDAHNERWFCVGNNVDYETDEIYNNTPARAWLIAILRALIAEGRDDLPFSIGSQNARVAKAAIERLDIEARESQPDWKRTEYGTVEGEIAGLTRWNGKPALVVTERLSEKDFTCVLSDDLSETLGPMHSWDEVWDGRRVHLSGALHYNSDGDLKRADIEDFEEVPWTDVTIQDLKSIDVLGEKTMQEHLRQVRY